MYRFSHLILKSCCRFVFGTVIDAMGNKRSKYNTGLWPQGVYKFMALVTRLTLRKMPSVFSQQPASVLCYTARLLFYLHKMRLARDICRCVLKWCSLRLKLNLGALQLSFLVLGGIEQNKKKISLMLAYNSLKTAPSTLGEKEKMEFEIEDRDGAEAHAVKQSFTLLSEAESCRMVRNSIVLNKPWES